MYCNFVIFQSNTLLDAPHTDALEDEHLTHAGDQSQVVVDENELVEVCSIYKHPKDSFHAYCLVCCCFLHVDRQIFFVIYIV